MHPRVLSELRYQLITPLCVIYETSYNTGCIPRDWKFANTVPTSKAECNNNRPVSLTNAVCNVMESVIRDHIMNFFLDNDFFRNTQDGFLKGRSTVLQLLSIIDEWTRN